MTRRYDDGMSRYPLLPVPLPDPREVLNALPEVVTPPRVNLPCLREENRQRDAVLGGVAAVLRVAVVDLVGAAPQVDAAPALPRRDVEVVVVEMGERDHIAVLPSRPVVKGAALGVAGIDL